MLFDGTQAGRTVCIPVAEHNPADAIPVMLGEGGSTGISQAHAADGRGG
jgi:hypothetical protein